MKPTSTPKTNELNTNINQPMTVNEPRRPQGLPNEGVAVKSREVPCEGEVPRSAAAIIGEGTAPQQSAEESAEESAEGKLNKT